MLTDQTISEIIVYGKREIEISYREKADREGEDADQEEDEEGQNISECVAESGVSF